MALRGVRGGLAAIAGALTLPVLAGTAAAPARAQAGEPAAVVARWKLNDATAAVPAPVAYWKMDEPPGATRAEDVEGRLPAGAEDGAGFGTPGRIGGALHLPGSGAYARTGGPAVDTTKSFSVSAWTRLAARTPAGAVIAQDGTVGSAFALYYSGSTDRWVFGMQDPDSSTPTRVRVRSTAAPALDTWTHLTGVYDATAGQIRLYVDGTLQQDRSQPNAWNGAGPLELGRLEHGGAYTGHLSGDLDDVRVFDQAITAPQVALLAGTSSATPATPDDGPAGRDAILAGDAFVDQGNAWVGSGALALDGDGDHAATTGPVIDTSRSFSVTGWVETPSWPDRAAAIFSQSGAVASGFTLRFAPDPANPGYGRYQFDLPSSDAAGATHQTVSHSAFQSNGPWDAVAVVYDADAHEMRLYVNGQLDASVPSYRGGVSAFDATGPFQLGRTKADGAYGEYWPGSIDDVWVFRGVLDHDQIIELSSGAELPTDGFPVA